MRATTSDRLSINFETEGHGSPLVLLHGFGDQIASWREAGYVNPLVAAGHRLIMVDQRGHGASGRPHDRASYVPEKRAGDVIAVLDILGIERADVLGYSMGGWCALNVARFHPDRVGRLVVGGCHPFGQSLSLYRWALVSKLVWAGVARTGSRSLSKGWKHRIRSNDILALRAAVADDRPDISASLTRFDHKCLFYAGAKDLRCELVSRSADTLPNAKFLELQHCDHLSAYTQPDRLIPHLVQFLAGEPAPH